jgi:hypothetical protein
MKYSKSDSEYFRNKKGGGLETNGTLNASNFSRNQNNRLKEINIRKNENTHELPEMNSSGKYKINPIKIMVKKKSFGANEHYIFFGLNRETGIYEYVIYLNPDFSRSGGSPIICKKRNDDGTIVELSHEQFLDINIRELSILIYNLLLKNQQNRKLLHENFFRYLLDHVLPNIIEKSNSITTIFKKSIVFSNKNIVFLYFYINYFIYNIKIIYNL